MKIGKVRVGKVSSGSSIQFETRYDDLKGLTSGRGREQVAAPATKPVKDRLTARKDGERAVNGWWESMRMASLWGVDV